MDKYNIQAFVEYFQTGCKEAHTGAVGMEAEHFIIKKQDLSAVGYFGSHGIEALLTQLSPHFLQKGSKEGHLIALGTKEYVISLEPSCQLEISLMPQTRLKQIAHIYKQFIELLEPILEKWEESLITTGYHPTEKSENLELIPKGRYQYMNRYFEEIGEFGRCMMRGTASVQGSVDYYSEEDFVRTYRAAVACSPLFALVTDNSPIFEKAPWKKHMLRTYIWEQVDKERCSIVPGTFEPGFGFEAYAKWLYEVPTIYREMDGREEYVGKQSLKTLYANTPLCEEQLEHGISMVFPDVRLKQYIEIRVGDSMPLEYALSYIALIKGLFYNRDELYKLYKKFEQYTQLGSMKEADVQKGKQQLIAYGYEGEIYGKKPRYWLEQMLELAESQLEQEEKVYLRQLKRLVAEQKSVRDITTVNAWIERIRKKEKKEGKEIEKCGAGI